MASESEVDLLLTDTKAALLTALKAHITGSETIISVVVKDLAEAYACIAGSKSH